MLKLGDNNYIGLTRGDTAKLSISLQDSINYEPYVFDENDTLTLTVKKNVNESAFLFQKKVTGNSIIHIKPTDTAGLSFTKYVYDIQLETSAGDVYTVIGPATFECLKEVTY